MPDFSPLAPIATVLASLVAAAAALYGVKKNFESSRKLSEESKETQRLLKSEERAQTLRNEHVSPFFAELTHNFDLAKDVYSHVTTLNQQCPLSAVFKRQLLANAGVVFALGDSAVALSGHRVKVLLVLNRAHVEDFAETLDKLFELQMKMVLCLLDSFDFSDKAFDEFKTDYFNNPDLTKKLFVSTRNAIHSTRVDGEKDDWPNELSDTILGKVPAKLKYQYIKGAASWSVWWSISLPSDAVSTTAYESFCSERDKFYAAMEDVEGVLEKRTERENDQTKHHHSRITVRFASHGDLEKFLNVLPELKVQTKQLWIESVSPRELIA